MNPDSMAQRFGIATQLHKRIEKDDANNAVLVGREQANEELRFD